MKRRTFITGLGSAVAWSMVARAQQAALPVIGFVDGGSDESRARPAAAFRRGLGEVGYVEGQNVIIQYHWLEGQYDRAAALIADLVRRHVAVIATPGSATIAIAARAATATVPIVFGVGDNPVKLGRQPCSAGWPRNWRKFSRRGSRCQATGAPACTGAQGSSCRCDSQSLKPHERGGDLAGGTSSRTDPWASNNCLLCRHKPRDQCSLCRPCGRTSRRALRRWGRLLCQPGGAVCQSRRPRPHSGVLWATR